MAAFLAFAVATSASANFAPCMPNMTCFQLTPYHNRSDLVFDCAAINASSQPAKGNVYFMHGNDGPRAKGMWSLMMTRFADQGYNNLACDQRGFSPGASPNASSEYNYDFLAQDIFAVADSYFGASGKFHVVAHDQGGRVGWHALRPAGAGRARFATYSALAEAHSDAFSDALYGPNADPVQQLRFMYLRDFTLANPAYIYNGAIFNNVCKKYYAYTSQFLCQTAVWWYGGAVASGNLAVQPFNGTFGQVGASIGIPASFVNDNTPYPLSGLPQRTKVGLVPEVPVLYMCGSGEYADICNDRMRDESAKLVENFAYARIQGCGHDLTTPSSCSNYQLVIETILQHVESGAPIQTTKPALTTPDPTCGGHAKSECTEGPAFWCCDLVKSACLCDGWDQNALEEFCIGTNDNGYIYKEPDFCTKICPGAPECSHVREKQQQLL
eukprot:m.102342 g.102342  ORF g.102342 m.102342 type:complete len:441 (-) comp27406_c1_seq1:192-1514(-)